MSSRPRVCIATSGYYRPGETFVNHHIQKLFGGASAVISAKASRGNNPFAKPLLSIAEVKAPKSELLTTLPALTLNLLRYRTSKVPVGRAAQEIEAFLKQHRIEVILCEFGNRALQIAPIAGRLGIPVFTYFRGYDASKLLNEGSYPAAYRRLMPQLAGVFAVSDFLLKNLEKRGIRHSNAHVAPSGADTDLFRPAEKTPQLIVAAGRMVAKKMPLQMTDVFIDVARSNTDAQFVFYGDGAHLEECRTRVRAAGLEHQISLPGAKPHAEIADALSRATIFAQHSATEKNGNTEGLPSSIQEAMACGCAVVSTRHAGIPEAVIEGETGLLVDELDFKAHAEALKRLLADPKMTADMGLAARQFALAHLDKAKLTAKIEAIMAAAVTR